MAPEPAYLAIIRWDGDDVTEKRFRVLSDAIDWIAKQVFGRHFRYFQVIEVL